MDELILSCQLGAYMKILSIRTNLDIQCPSRDRGQGEEKDKLVNFVCYCVNPNHYHFLLEQAVDNGIEKFMQRLGNGYTKFFNNKYLRNGSLFQGGYKSVYH